MQKRKLKTNWLLNFPFEFFLVEAEKSEKRPSIFSLLLLSSSPFFFPLCLELSHESQREPSLAARPPTLLSLSDHLALLSL